MAAAARRSVPPLAAAVEAHRWAAEVQRWAAEPTLLAAASRSVAEELPPSATQTQRLLAERLSARALEAVRLAELSSVAQAAQISAAARLALAVGPDELAAGVEATGIMA